MYNIFIKVDDTALQLPINPEEIKFKYETSINRYEIIGLGEIAEPNINKLIETNINSFIPRINTNLVTNSNITANEFVEKINDARDEGQVIELVINRDSLDDISLDCIIGVFNIIEKAGEINDVYYELQLLQWKPHKARKIIIQKPAPLPLMIPVNETINEYKNTVGNDIKIRDDALKEKPNTSTELTKGDMVTANGYGYSWANGFLNLRKDFSNEIGTIENINKKKKYPYAVRFSLDMYKEKGRNYYYFEEGNLTLIKKGE